MSQCRTMSELSRGKTGGCPDRIILIIPPKNSQEKMNFPFIIILIIPRKNNQEKMNYYIIYYYIFQLLVIRLCCKKFKICKNYYRTNDATIITGCLKKLSFVKLTFWRSCCSSLEEIL